MFINLFFILSIKITFAGSPCPLGYRTIQSDTAEFHAKPCLEIVNVELFSIQMPLAQLSHSKIRRGYWKQVEAQKINLSESELTTVRIENSHLTSSIFQNTKFQGSRIIRTNLKGSLFKSARGDECYFENVDFSESDFRDADFSSCYFINCQFSKISLNKHTKFPQNVLRQKDQSWIFVD